MSASLGFLFAPRRIAVIGASDRPGSVGGAVLRNLRGYAGEVVPVNPRHAEVLGLAAVPDIRSVRAPVDLAVIVTPAESVAGLVAACAEAGVRGAIVVAAGFQEAGPAGGRRQAEVLAAAAGRVRILGPNCLGVMAPPVGLNATFSASVAAPGRVAFLSQSGALGTAFLDWSRQAGVGLSGFASVGTMADLGWPELLGHFAADPATAAILLYLESLGEVRAFVSAARHAAASKPVVALVPGRSPAAVRAAVSHTGAIAGGALALEAALRRSGILRVDTIAEFLAVAACLDRTSGRTGPRLAIVTNAGGPGALAADAAALAGGRLAELSPASRSALDDLLPAYWSHGNPVDVLGDADAGRFAAAVRVVAADPSCDGVLVVLTPQAMTDPAAVARGVAALVPLPAGRPLLASWLGGAAVEEGRAILAAAGVPALAFPDDAARAFARLAVHQPEPEVPASAPAPVVVGARDARMRRIIAAARAEGRTVLGEREAKVLLALSGVPVVPTRPARGVDEAVAWARRLGFPVVLKLHSRTLTHKAAAGGVRLGLRGPEEVRRAWWDIRAAALLAGPESDFLGVTVQPEIPAGGCEVIIGTALDAQLGPVVIFGAGGERVEHLGDQALDLVPLDLAAAHRLMARTRIHGWLRGGAGRPPADLASLARVLVAFSRVMETQAGIRELEANPLRVTPGGVVALDARAVLQPAGDA